MSVQLHWAQEADRERVVETRLLCYGHSPRDEDRIRSAFESDHRGRITDVLLAERSGTTVGTATSLRMSMRVRGGEVSCQGVAWVGTVKTERRKGSKTPGIGTLLMQELLAHAREQGCVVSALMPFRGSFYEHFGYGTVERRVDWTVPLSILRTNGTEGFRVAKPEDRDDVIAARDAMATSGQCDLDRGAAGWDYLLGKYPDHFLIIDRPRARGPVESWMLMGREHIDGKDIAQLQEIGYTSIDALERQLAFLSTLKDQYSAVTLTLPADIPLNLLIREPQIPHRPVNHAVAEARPYTRMQLRVLNHKAMLEAMHLPQHVRGAANVGVQESEATLSRFRVEVADGRASVSDFKGDPDVGISDNTWAQIATGDLSASHAHRLGLIAVSRPAALQVLDALAVGPLPFTTEYF